MRLTVCGLVLVSCVLAYGQGVHPVTGRPYAGVMSADGAPWLTRPEREEEEQPDRALDEIGVAKGSSAADIGAGSGAITWRLAERVGPAGKVYAVDIQRRMLDLLRQNMAQRKLFNVEPVLGAVDDPKLPDASVDLEVLIDVYHEFSHPQEMLRHLRAALKPDGRMVLLEYRAEDPAVPIRPEHKMTLAMVKAEVEPEGFRLANTIETLPRQHLIVFQRDARK
ncbi:MAG TPA: class I SAM-dependent methyltransferase [Bryobacteraceae bacterium]|jgi:ubiquinone/menaquinone biosynthesis C-methylase UbiE|nr:class I SAM-dependent methyltransferase [Bryobacteraceae bacterium]